MGLFRQKLAAGLIPFCLISVGYHSELHIAITFSWEYHFNPKNISTLNNPISLDGKLAWK